jgi:predicted enzyme related to lactoylglutathione lyase
MTMITKIATAAVYVDDQEQAVQFWVEQVGFRIHREQTMGPNAKWIEVGPAQAESCLVIYPKAMLKDWAERKPSLVFECQDIQQTYQDMTHRGVQFTQDPKDMAWSWFAVFVDPEGNWYGLRQQHP